MSPLPAKEEKRAVVPVIEFRNHHRPAQRKSKLIEAQRPAEIVTSWNRLLRAAIGKKIRSIQSALYIGVGGAGLGTLSKLKRELRRQGIAADAKFLAFDTDSTAKAGAANGDPFSKMNSFIWRWKTLRPF